MSIIKEDNNKKYWIIGIVLLLAVGIYLVVTNVDFSKLNKEKQLNQDTAIAGNVSNPWLDDINNFFIGVDFGSIGMLMISIFVFGLSLIFMLGNLFPKKEDNFEDNDDVEEEENEEDNEY